MRRTVMAVVESQNQKAIKIPTNTEKKFKTKEKNWLQKNAHDILRQNIILNSMSTVDN